MPRGQQNFLDLIVQAQCCAASMAYSALKQEMYLKPDRIVAFKNVRYIQALLGIMNRYYDTVYCLEDIPCLSDEEIEVIIEKVLELCNLCGCCSDSIFNTISNNPAPPSNGSGPGLEIEV